MGGMCTTVTSVIPYYCDFVDWKRFIASNGGYSKGGQPGMYIINAVRLHVWSSNNHFDKIDNWKTGTLAFAANHVTSLFNKHIVMVSTGKPSNA